MVYIILKCIKYIYGTFLNLNAHTHPNNILPMNLQSQSNCGQQFWSTHLQLVNAFSVHCTGFKWLNTYLQSKRIYIKNCRIFAPPPSSSAWMLLVKKVYSRLLIGWEVTLGLAYITEDIQNSHWFNLFHKNNLL